MCDTHQRKISWVMSKKDEYLLCIFERKILRRIFGGVNINSTWLWRNNNELYQLYNCHDIVTYIKVQRLRWAGYIQRATEDYSPKQIMGGEMSRNSRPGRPKLRWPDGVERDVAIIGVRGWRSAAMDRRVWRRKLEQALVHGRLSYQWWWWWLRSALTPRLVFSREIIRVPGICILLCITLPKRKAIT